MLENKTKVRKPKRSLPWIIAALILGLLAILYNPSNISQVLGKLFAPCAGAVLGALIFDRLVPYLKPSARLAAKWFCSLTFKEGESDFEISDGKDAEFLVCGVLKVLCIISGMFCVSLGN